MTLPRALNEAYISESDVHSWGDLKVLANDAAVIDVFTGIISGGLVGIGGSVPVTSIGNTTTARITGCTTNASGRTEVNADSVQRIGTTAGTLGAGFAGVAGSVAVSSIGAATQAYIDSGSRVSWVNQDPAFASPSQDVFVIAHDTASIDDDTGTTAA